MRNTAIRVSDGSEERILISRRPRKKMVQPSVPEDMVEVGNGNSENFRQNRGMDAKNSAHFSKDVLKSFQINWNVESKGISVDSTKLGEKKQGVDIEGLKSKEIGSVEMVSSCTGVECEKDANLIQPVQEEKDSMFVLGTESAAMSSNEMKSLSTQSPNEESQQDKLQANSNELWNDESKSKSKSNSNSNSNSIHSLSYESSSEPTSAMRKRPGRGRGRGRGRVFLYSRYRRNKQTKPTAVSSTNINNNIAVVNEPTKASHGEFFLGDTERLYNTRYKQAIRNAMRSNSNFKSPKNKNFTSPPRLPAPPKNYAFAEDYDTQPMKLLVLLSSMEPDTVVPSNSIHS